MSSAYFLEAKHGEVSILVMAQTDAEALDKAEGIVASMAHKEHLGEIRLVALDRERDPQKQEQRSWHIEGEDR